MDWTKALRSEGRVYWSSEEEELWWVVGAAVELNGGTGGRSEALWWGGAFSLSVTCDSWLEVSPGFEWGWVESWEGLSEEVWIGAVGRGNS